MNDLDYMKEALKEAQKAQELDEVPVGAVIVKEGKIIARGYNERETLHKPNGHAEIMVIEQAGDILQSWNLKGCTLYVTVEPCIMCAGTAIMSRIDRIVFGAYEPRSGSFGSLLNLNEIKGFHHYPEIQAGILEKESSDLLIQYFKTKREEKSIIRKITEAEWKDYLNLREEVFVHEQAIAVQEEYDDYDVYHRDDVIHVGAFINQKLVGTMRLIKDDTILKVGRLAVLSEARNQKVGSKLLGYAEKQALNNGFKQLRLGAQLQAKVFYEHNGYHGYGEPFLEVGIEHIMMKKDIR